MIPPAPRSSFTLPAAGDLRASADRAIEHARRRGRPRDRYLGRRRSTLVRYLVPCFALASLIGASVAVVDVAAASFVPDRRATAAEGTASLVLAACIVVIVAMRRSLRAIVMAHAFGAAASELAWGVAAHFTGGAASPYLLALPLCHVLFAGVVPAEPWVAAVSGVASYAALLVASPAAPIPTHLVVIAAALGTVVLALSKHQQGMRSFVQTERLAASMARMRRVQEQLVVVEKLEALRVLVGGMAHELNNALAISIASNQQAARDAEGNALAKAAIARSDGGLQRIKKTVDRLRRFAMAAEGVLEPADVAAMLDFALESAIGRARSGVVIERHYDAQIGALEVHVSALAEALYQVARNAVEAMPGGGTIQAAVRKEGDRIVLSVADQGQGITPEEMPRIFDPFFRTHSKKGSTTKSGLGLSAVYGLITAIGGHIDIKSEVGKGTEVAIAMPARRPATSIRPPPT